MFTCTKRSSLHLSHHFGYTSIITLSLSQSFVLQSIKVHEINASCAFWGQVGYGTYCANREEKCVSMGYYYAKYFKSSHSLK